MSNDIERLLAEAADDSDQPMHTTVDDLLIRARRSTRHRRIATAATAVFTTAAVIGGVAAWSTTRSQSEAPAGITIDRNGQLIDTDSGQVAKPAPPVSPLSDAEVLRRCKTYDNENLVSIKERGGGPPGDKAGVIDARWKVVVKTGDQNKLDAMFLSPDKSILSTCTMESPERISTYARFSATQPMALGSDRTPGDPVPEVVDRHVKIPVPGVTRVLFNLITEKTPREARVGADGYYSLGFPDWENVIDPDPVPGKRSAMPEPNVQRIRAYDATGKKVYEWKYEKPVLPTQPTVDPSVTIKTADPVEPEKVFTKDPASGKALAPTPVSPLSDDQVRDRCALWEHEINTNPVYGGGKTDKDPRDEAAGPITHSWSVALKTGTGDKLTALLVSPDRKVLVWCHMTKPTTKGGESDFTRTAVKADGTFGDTFEFGMVPPGVAQIIVDLPKTGPTLALLSHGFYIWGVTGGNSDLKKVRVRGFDAQGKQVYNVQKQVDAS